MKRNLRTIATALIAVLLAGKSFIHAQQPKATATLSPPPSPSATASPVGAGAKPYLSAVQKMVEGASPSPSASASAAASPSASTSPRASSSPAKPVTIRFRPSKDALEAPFYDVPFALHVPLEVRHEGGPVCVVWRITMTWENPPKEWYDQTYSFSTAGRGIYRIDGKQPAKDSVRRSGSPAKWKTDATVPTFVFGGSGGFKTEKDKHKPMAERDDSLVMDPAQPGWYALWFAFDLPSGVWPAKEAKRDFLQGAFHIDTLVSRGKDEPTSAEIEYLFGRGKRPDKMQEDKFYKATTTDLTFKLRRDGWEFDHAEARVYDREKVEKKRIQINPRFYRTYKCQQKIGGKEVELEVNEKIQSDPRGEITDKPLQDQDNLFDTVYLIDEKWKASFPQSIPDNAFGIVKFTGEQKKRFQQKPSWNPESMGPTYRWQPTRTDVYKEDGKEREKSAEHQSEILSPMEKSHGTGEADIRKRFLDDYGKDAAEWCVPGFYEDLMGGPKQGEPPYQFVIRGLHPRRMDADTTEIGAYPLVVYSIGPWTLIGHYKRLSEVEGRTVASKTQPGEATIVSDVDKFWDWYVELTKVLEEQIPKATEAQIHATHEATPLQSLIKSRDRLTLSMQGDTGPASRGLQRVWNAKDKIWEWLDNDLPKTGIGTMPGGSEPGSVNTPVKASPEMAAKIQKKLQEITAEINEHRQNISKDTTTARDAYQKVNDKLEEGNQKFGGPGHGELYIWRRRYREAFEQIPIDIARASKDPEMLKRALDEALNEGTSANTCVLEAELYRASGDSISALEALRRGVRLEKDHVLAVPMLADAECAFLQRAIEKSQGAIAQARQHFYGYLMERGFADQDILANPKDRLDWLSTRVGIYGEEAWAVFTTGLFGSFSAFYGKPAAEAELLATTERQMTTAFVGLHTMRLLRKNGVTFDEMRKITSSEVRDKLGMRDRGGQMLSDGAAANIGVAIREAMKLADVQALVSGNAEALRDGIKQGYWDSTDVDNTWIEYFGDITSAYNLFTLLLPAAKVGTAGRTMNPLVWTKAEATMIGELQALGQVTSGTEALASAVGVSRKLNALGATEGGKKVISFMRGLEEYQSALGAFDKAVWTTGKITGALTIGYATVSTTEKLAGHKAAMLVGAALMFATDTDLLMKLLKSRNIPPKAIGSIIISDYLPATKLHVKRLAATQMTAGELRALFDRVKGGSRLVQADREFLNKYFGSDWRTLIPGPNACENATIPLLAAGEGAANSVNNGAISAVEKKKAELTAEAEATAQTLQEEEQVASALNGAVTDPNPVGGGVEQPGTPPRGPPGPERPVTSKLGAPAAAVPPPPPKPKPLRPPPPTPEYPPSAQRVLPEETRAAGELGGYVINPPLCTTSKTAEAIVLLNNGEYAAAERKLIEVQDLIRQGVLTEAEEMTMERLHMFRMVANDLQRVTKKIPTGRSPINTAIPAATVDQVLDNPGILKPLKTSGAMSEVFEVEGHPDLFVKKIRSKFERLNPKTNAMETVEINILEDVENNLIHEELARAMGFDVPAMEARIIYDASGQPIEAYYVMRKVKGRPLSEMTAGEIYLYREELARHRALATLIGDFDRKLDNYIITEEGHFVPIDAGMGDASGERLARECAKEGADYRPDLPWSIDGVYGRDHWYAKAINEAPGPEILTYKKTLFRKFLIAEESMTFQGAESAVNAIEKYFVNGASAAEAEKLLGDAYMKMFFQERVKRLAQLKGANLADSAVRAALEQEALQTLQAKIQGAVEKVNKNLKVRAPHIRDSMKGLNQRNGIPVFETDVSFSTPLHIDTDFIIRFTLQHFLTNAILRRAA